MQPHSIAVIGAGFSGTLLTLHLLRHCPPATSIRLIEQSPGFGTGLAYATACSEHRLNVPAGRMSAFPDRPRDFLDWLERQPAGVLGGQIPDAGSFVPRQLYGRYLQSLLTDAIRTSPEGRLELVRGKTLAISRERTGLMLCLAEGRTLMVSSAVIATGNNTPADPLPALRGTPLYRPNPWACDVVDGIAPGGTVLLVGTGLTMIDTVLQLLDRGHDGPIHALSRRGLMPHAHARLPSTVPAFERRDIPHRFSDLVRFIRTRSRQTIEAGGSWHAVVDALRPVTQEIWRTASVSDRRRFLTHLRPWWDVHRHRVAPSIADRIEAARASGQLYIHAGRITGFALAGNAAEVSWRPRGKSATQSLHVDRLINCTGPETDIARSPDPLFQSLLSTGMARPDPLGLGFDVTEDGRFRGNASDQLFGVGPICRSALWEITAVPDIRAQCESLAHRIACLMRQRDAAYWASQGVPALLGAAAEISGLWF
jgi:uncharacterized NAD(P)/FAD-binding protein YdhS